MNDFKILISPAKTFNKDALVSSKAINTMFLDQSKEIFSVVAQFSGEEIQRAYKVSNKISKEVLGYNKVWNKQTYKAIDLFGGMVFNQLNITKENRAWVNDHILILDALYGIIRPNDYISRYRLDFKTTLDIDLKKAWKDKVNNYLKDFKVYSLASKEYTDLLDIYFEEISTDKSIKMIKIARGKKLNKLINKGELL